MDIVLFGAGASHGSGPTQLGTPPLGNQLYAELTRAFPGSWGSLPTIVDAEFIGRTFEAGMEKLWSNHSSAVPVLMRHMTLYFAQFRPAADSNLYSRFISSIRSSKGSLTDMVMASLNYDMLLELAASQQGLLVDYFGDSPASSSKVVWKLHGSCNLIPVDMQASRGVSFTAGVVFNTGLRAVDPNDAIAFCLSDTALYPAMCLYMSGKHVQIGASTIQTLQDKWRKAVLEAAKVLIIGVAPNIEDTHIWQPIGETPATIGYVGDREFFESWATDQRASSGLTVVLGSRWDQSFSSSLEFLRSD